jgi:hypothetical protein
MRLPVREQRAERIETIDRWVDAFRAACPGDELAWICMPHLIIYLRARFEPGHHETSPVSAHRVEQIWTRERSNPLRPTSLSDGHLFFAFSENQRLAQAPIAGRVGSERPSPGQVSVSRERESTLVARSVELVEILIATARRQSLELPVKRRLLYRLFFRAARDLSCWEALVESVRPRTVTIGSTHSAAARSLAMTCRGAGIPCVYVPHAPVLGEARLADLPVDFAGLRGPAELAYYAEQGADAGGMAAIGNPSVDPVEVTRPGETGELAPAFALPTDDAWALEQLVALVEEALGDRVLASPHPRADRDGLRALLPKGWEVWKGRTWDLLRRGPPVLLQASSGVGLEGLQLGVPTIELAFPDEEPNYPYLRDRSVQTVSTADDLRDAVEAADRIGASERDEIRRRARPWVCAVGDEAAQAGAQLVRRAAAEGVGDEPIWDAWGPESGGAPKRISDRFADGASNVA